MGSGDVDVGLGDDAHPEVVEGASQEARERRDEGHGAVAALGTNTDLGEISNIKVSVGLEKKITKEKDLKRRICEFLPRKKRT